jgi:hypothetical protein
MNFVAFGALDVAVLQDRSKSILWGREGKGGTFHLFKRITRESVNNALNER